MEKPRLIRHSPTGHGMMEIVPEVDPVMKFVSMNLLRLNKGEKYSLKNIDRELGVVIVKGSCNAIGGSKDIKLKGRKEPLADWPYALYIPPAVEVSITALSDLEMVVYGTPAEKRDDDFFVITPSDCKVLNIGNGNWTLQGTFVIDADGPSQNLIVGETHIPSGNWCSTPPHSHDTDIPGKQTFLEEVYYFRFKPSQGFGFQGIYTLDRSLDEAYIIRDGDITLIPRGMHPNVAGPGYEMYMLWGMAGHSKEWIPFEDPDHNWIGSLLD
ncbi:MAG: 5-deoxy-glucuronate isomerase [Chloroflexi bacterium GWB2_49_20]|nr:MAG: 5-deoxy-glucuronate isomerase [Chloroflexi bacterium GWB2_49_20]OGN78014.1 MAG: 5-deoxy-glucuronate isomerase [Chloroflexi bacterium GWC2_49_37]OGN85052.1 MAG: 5-deoxy-glucuronate isomerase [Chloroflexi bacterium GWD2_49_16]